ncbi:MAG: hypothetical protein KDA65_16350 [Planctomycetaceae bacterium]|nr:hypothetical protein [Planctomycetaceae bacterium]
MTQMYHARSVEVKFLSTENEYAIHASMKTISHQNFGILIAYILPGFVTLYGIGFLSVTVQGWLAVNPAEAPTIAGFLYVTVASLGIGVVLNTVRRHTLDLFHQWTGIRQANWNYKELQENIAAIEFIIANQFRFHQFHGNLFLALPVPFTAYAWSQSFESWWWCGLFLIMEGIVFLGSRDCYRNYCRRLEEILGTR